MQYRNITNKLIFGNASLGLLLEPLARASSNRATFIDVKNRKMLLQVAPKGVLT